MDEKNMTELVKDFANIMNTYSTETQAKKFIEQFKREHRTIQQSMFGVILSLIVEMAGENYHVDGRNQKSKEMAEMFVKGYADQLYEKFKDSHGEIEAMKIKEACLKNPSLYFGVPMI